MKVKWVDDNYEGPNGEKLTYKLPVCPNCGVELIEGESLQECEMCGTKIVWEEERPTWDEYFMSIAKSAATRSTCISSGKGAAITVENHIVALGYSGAPAGVESCYEKGYCVKREKGFSHGTGHEVCLAVHAEMNAILSAARIGVKINGGTIYCTHKPCSFCAKLIINSGIKRVVYAEEYASQSTDDMLKEAQVVVERLTPD